MDERWKEIERIFNAAVELGPSEQAAFLKSACKGDELLRREVELLLAKAGQAGSFLETPALEVAARGLAKEEELMNPPMAELELGTVIAHYRVTGKLGAGGMGQVYRARDSKLQRDVALKILPQAMARDPQRMARFEREAQVLASFNHPNIGAIYGLEESNGIRALAMELVEGETLAEWIDGSVAPGFSPASGGLKASTAQARRQGPIPIDEALPIAKQVCEALEYAHERGIIHRDLKPANIKVTPEGSVKILDFGLAKVLSPNGPPEALGLSSSPTANAAATELGMILGTAAYMSPEQAKGQPVDQRCDVWAFGCVLYEMLTGTRAFGRSTFTETLAAVINDEADMGRIPPSMPAAITKLIRRCLTKDLRQRLQAIGEARITIEEQQSGISDGEVGPGLTDRIGSPRSPLQRAAPWAIAGVASAALLVVVLLWKFAASRPQEFPAFFYISPPAGTAFRDFGFGAGPIAVSPDGTKLAFSATDENGLTELYVRPLASNATQAIAGTDDAARPFWAPDGRSIGFFADQKLKTVNLDNGNVQVLADAVEDVCASGGAWSPEGVILYTPRGCNGTLSEIPASGGVPRPATHLESGALGQTSPFFLSGGRKFLFLSNSGFTESIWMASLHSNAQRLVLKGAASPQFASERLLFIRNNHVFAQPFDPASGTLSGVAAAVTEAHAYSVSDNGVFAFQGGTPQGRLEWFDRRGNPVGTVGPVKEYWDAKISPDGKRILADVVDPETELSDLWSYPAAGGIGTRLTFTPGVHAVSVWSPDGKNIAYSCFPGGKAGICAEPSDGSGSEKTLLILGPEVFLSPVVDWSPDGRYISFDVRSANSPGMQNWIEPLFGDHKPFQVAPVNAAQFDGNFSPDGRWMAYFSYETGRPEIYVVPFPGPGGKYQISQNGGWDVRWDKKGRLYFLTMGNRLMEADLGTGGKSLQVEAIHALFQLSLPSYADPLYDVSPDGTRFLVITSADPNASRSIGVLLDWQAKLNGEK